MKRWLAASVAVVLLALVLRSPAAPDPVAIKVQGPDTIGNAIPTITAGTPATGTSVTPITASSTGSNASQAATLAGVAAKTTYISGVAFTSGGSTAGGTITCTITGTVSGTLNFTFDVATGATATSNPLIMQFSPPIPGSAVNTAIVATIPAAGAGNTGQSVSAWGFQQ